MPNPNLYVPPQIQRSFIQATLPITALPGMWNILTPGYSPGMVNTKSKLSRSHCDRFKQFRYTKLYQFTIFQQCLFWRREQSRLFASTDATTPFKHRLHHATRQRGQSTPYCRRNFYRSKQHLFHLYEFRSTIALDAAVAKCCASCCSVRLIVVNG